jgi:hypothetical protein
MCANRQETATDAGILPKNSVLLVYPSWTMKDTLSAFANLLTLLVGITIGVLIAPRFEKHAEAHAAYQSGPTDSGPEQISPVITAGSMGTNLLLVHHTQMDELVVNGIDMLKLEQGEINLLARIPGVLPGQVQSIVDDSRKDVHLYQVAAPKTATPATPPAK